MRVRAGATWALRFVAMTCMAVWFGGFTFYSGIVIPVLHEAMGGVESGMVTGEVSNALNVFGVVAVLSGAALGWVERGSGERWVGRLRWMALGLNVVILGMLMAMHPAMDERLASGTLKMFYRLHQVYLIASTLQWGVCLAWIGLTVRVWQADGRARTAEA